MPESDDNNFLQGAESNGGEDSLHETLMGGGVGAESEGEGEGEGGFVVVERKQPVSRGTLALFGVIVAAMAGLYFMHLRSGPGSAQAASAETQAANDTINQFLASGNQNIAKMKLLIHDTEKIVAQFLQYPSVNQVPLNELKTNPFRYQSATRANADKAEMSEAEARRQREAERAAILKAVQGLQLQSIMHGEKSKACMISNTLYQEGQSIDIFTIERINPGSVIVRSGTYRFELKMQK